MFEIKIQADERRWGPLSNDLKNAKALLVQIGLTKNRFVESQNERKLNFWEIQAKQNRDLTLVIDEMNEQRRKSVLGFLKSEGLAICLLHQPIFGEKGLGNWLAPRKTVRLVRITSSWTCYPLYTEDYDVTACPSCCELILGKPFYHNGAMHSLCRPSNPPTKNLEELYRPEILDSIATIYYQMPLVTHETLELL